MFDRYTNELRAFKLDGSRYAEIALQDRRFWIPEIELGLGVWRGSYQGIEMSWLRWYDVIGWVLTPVEREIARVEREKQRAERLIAQLRSLGVEPDLD